MSTILKHVPIVYACKLGAFEFNHFKLYLCWMNRKIDLKINKKKT